MIYWICSFIFILSVAAYLRLSMFQWSALIGLDLLAFTAFESDQRTTILVFWIIYSIIVLLNIPSLRRTLISKRLFKGMKKIMPTISQTEQEALDAGDVWWEAELFSGHPDFNVIRRLPKPQLTAEEQAFIDGPVEAFCQLVDDWQITQKDYDLTPEAWQFAKDNGFFSLIIPKEYGGLDYSALCHSQVVMKIGSRSSTAGITIMVPNSLGPGKLLMTYGTQEQKEYYLPRLAKGIDIPCFGLTAPTAGSDAGAIPDSGIVCRATYNGKPDVLGVRLNFEKRYITLAPVATLLGIAFKLFDPDHLLSDQEERGITLILIKRDTPGVEIGKRHFPAGQAFMNGPVRGKDVFLPLEDIIGGADYIGKGWSMLMECLGDGRAISLPAISTACGKVTAKYTGAYSRIRSQFNTPIGHFEGVEEVLTKIAGQCYAIDAARLMILSALDEGIVPSVLSGVVKQQSTERMREVVNHSMDIHGGHGICIGPRNFLARAYQIIPVGITVEGANILTRTMIIFGQGAMRSHPFLLKEVEAVHNKNENQGLIDFDQTLFAHIGFVISNKVRSFWLGLTGARFVSTPGNQDTRYYYQQIVRMSAAFALLSDICLAVLGGSLKRREKISGRLADIISNLYICSAVLKHYEDEGEQKADLPLMKWACDDALYNVQNAMKNIMKNLPVKYIGSLCNMMIFPLTKPYQAPGDNLGRRVARLTLTPSDALDRLSHGIYNSNDPDEAYGRINQALEKVIATQDIEKKCRNAYRSGQLSQRGYAAYAEAKDKNIITDDEYQLLKQTEAAVHNAIKVDEFSFKGWETQTP